MEPQTPQGVALGNLVRGITYYPLYKKMTGSFNAGLIVSAIVSRLVDGDSIELTKADILYMTGFSNQEYKTAMEKIDGLVFLQTSYNEEWHSTKYTVDFDVLCKCVEDAYKPDNPKDGENSESRQVRLLPTWHTYIFNNNYNNNNNNVDHVASNQTYPDKQKSPYLKYAKYLAKYVSKSRKLKISPSGLGNWASEFRKLVEVKGCDLKRMQRALKWYCSRLEDGLDEYDPVIQSGSSFNKKFTQIEDAMDRENKKTPRKESLLTVDSLTSNQKKEYDKMYTNLENLQDVRIETMPQLVVTLCNHYLKCRKRLKASDMSDKIKELYSMGLVAPDNFLSGYALWIQHEVPKWRGFAGDLRIFEPSNPKGHFSRYIAALIKRKNYTFSEKLREVLDEA